MLPTQYEYYLSSKKQNGSMCCSLRHFLQNYLKIGVNTLNILPTYDFLFGSSAFIDDQNLIKTGQVIFDKIVISHLGP